VKRVKRRYLALQLDSEASPSGKEFLDAVWVAVMRLYGEFGASQAGLALVNYDEERKIAVVRVWLAALQSVRASLALITRLTGKDATVHVLAVSGTIKSLREKSMGLSAS
jgi:ribonuclease P/MRP protein subunit POP5